MEYYSKSFDIALLLGDPFALATISVATIGWLIAFASSVVADIDGPYPTFSWWGVVYQLLLILGVVYVICANAVDAYKLALVGFSATALVYSTNSTNNLVYTGRAADAAAAAGHILLSIINVLWVFYFGTTSDARPHAFVDSYALRRPQPDPVASRPPKQTQQVQPPSARPQQMFTSAQLSGFETTSVRNAGLSLTRPSTTTVSHANPISSDEQMSALDMPTEYPLRARAIYSYDANPEDANEISFVKGEILEVSDVSGRWWQARRLNGEVGICPSNYVQLLE